MDEDVDGLALEPVASLTDLLYSTAKLRNVSAPDLAASDSAAYLDHLVSLPLHSLLEEASLISSEASTVESDLVNLCYREYSTFISVHRCSSAVTSAFSDFSSSLSNLLNAVPDLEEECKSFVKSTAGVQGARASAALVQEHQDKLFDLLEIPQLMGTCVRNGYYQEALELSSHAEELAARYPSNRLVQDVAKEVDDVLQLMLAQLLALLREPIKLPSLMKAVGFLRRLEKIDEADLALVFLIGRLHNFHMQLVGIERDRADVVRYVRKYIDIFREHVFDIISQFTTIFLDGPTSSSLASQLASFAEHCASELVDFIAMHVPRMTTDAASLSSILVQLGYCSLSFARVGLDFASLVTGPFISTVSDAYAQGTSIATSNLVSSLRHANKAASPPSAILLTSEYLTSILTSEFSFPVFTPVASHEELPAELANFPPIAIFVNAHLSILNSLRLLAPFSLHPTLSLALSTSLTSGTAAVLKYVQEAMDSFDPVPAINGGESSRSGSSSKRIPSSPRAQLLRRNSETQMSPELRSAKRREAKMACAAFASAWISLVCPFLTRSLDSGIYSVSPLDVDATYQSSLVELERWLDAQREVADPQTPVLPTSIQPVSRTNDDDALRSPKTPDAIPEEDEHIYRDENANRAPENDSKPVINDIVDAPIQPNVSNEIEPVPASSVGDEINGNSTSAVIENMFAPVATSSDGLRTIDSDTSGMPPLPADLENTSTDVTEQMETVLEAAAFTATKVQAPIAVIPAHHDSPVLSELLASKETIIEPLETEEGSASKEDAAPLSLESNAAPTHLDHKDGNEDGNAEKGDKDEEDENNDNDNNDKKEEKEEKNEKVEKIEEVAKVEKVGEVEKVEKVDEIKKTEIIEVVAEIEKVEKVEKVADVEKVEKDEKLAKVEKAETEEQVEMGNKADDNGADDKGDDGNDIATANHTILELTSEAQDEETESPVVEQSPAASDVPEPAVPSTNGSGSKKKKKKKGKN